MEGWKGRLGLRRRAMCWTGQAVQWCKGWNMWLCPPGASLLVIYIPRQPPYCFLDIYPGHLQTRCAYCTSLGCTCGLLCAALLGMLQMKKNVPRFLNRLLGLSLAEQHMAFGYFQVKLGCSLLAWRHLVASRADCMCQPLRGFPRADSVRVLSGSAALPGMLHRFRTACTAVALCCSMLAAV